MFVQYVALYLLLLINHTRKQTLQRKNITITNFKQNDFYVGIFFSYQGFCFYYALDFFSSIQNNAAIALLLQL